MKSVLIVQNYPQGAPGTISEFLSTRQLAYQVVRSYDSSSLPDPSEYSAVICLGCPASVNQYHEQPHLTELYALVAKAVRANVSYLGICFGGQLLAKVLGAQVTANPVKEVGLYDVRLTEAGKADPVFASLGHSFPVMQWHGDTFAIPFGCERLVEGTDCANQAFRHGRQVALQFHPEATETLVQSWCEAYPNEPAEVEKAVPELLMEFRSSADTMRQMNFEFLDTFFSHMSEDQLTNHTLQARSNRAH